jgi:hypothetical protein
VTKKKPRAATRGESKNQYSNQNQTGPVNTMTTTIRKTASALDDLDCSIVHVSCNRAGCDQFGSTHEAPAFDPDGVEHLRAGLWATAPGDVVCYWDAALNRWHASAYLSDGDAPLTPSDVHAFTDAWDAAYAAAQQLNASALSEGTEATC